MISSLEDLVYPFYPFQWKLAIKPLHAYKFGEKFSYTFTQVESTSNPGKQYGEYTSMYGLVECLNLCWRPAKYLP